jgi:S1-C subfamily serine protease
MKFNPWLLPAASILLAGTPTLLAPVKTIAQAEFPTRIAAVNPTQASCQKASAAVVTVYAGKGVGSGSIVSPEGLVITNNHVVREVVASGGRKPIYIRTAGGNRYLGQILKTDPRNDLALVRLQTQDRLPTIPLATSAGLRSGQPVCAIGSPFGRPGVLSQGTFTEFQPNGDLRSAVTLNPGNSGGPLLNSRGEMIGVNKAIWQSTSGRNTGISFATSAQVAKQFIAQGVSGQKGRTIFPPTIAKSPTLPKNSRLGVTLDSQNLIVQQVEFGSPAASSGLRPGDRLLAINGARLIDFEDLRLFLTQQPKVAILTIARDRRIANVRISF